MSWAISPIPSGKAWRKCSQLFRCYRLVSIILNYNMFVMRKQMLLTFLGCFVITLVYCQRMELPVVKVNSYGYSLPQNFYSPNNVGNNYGGADVQNQFKNGQWTRGRVKFQNGQEM